MRINIEIKDETHKKAKLTSIIQNITLKDYIAKAIEEKLKETKENEKKK